MSRLSLPRRLVCHILRLVGQRLLIVTSAEFWHFSYGFPIPVRRDMCRSSRVSVVQTSSPELKKPIVSNMCPKIQNLITRCLKPSELKVIRGSPEPSETYKHSV